MSDLLAQLDYPGDKLTDNDGMTDENFASDSSCNNHHPTTLEETLQFSDTVERAISSIVTDDDPFSRTDFDVTDYINQVFPTEQSLCNIDDLMGRMKMDIQEIDTEIADIVQSQSAASVDGQQAVIEAKSAILELFSRIREIKAKTDMSESMVKEITRDIKQLDIAKKNLTASITTLNHLHMLLSGVEFLQSYAKTKDYAEIANLLPGIMTVLEHFDRYLAIPQIKELYDQVHQIRKQLTTQVIADFKENFSTLVPSKISAQHAQDVCRVISVLDKSIKHDLITWFLQQQLAEYLVLFEDTQDSAWLDRLEERYKWFCHKLTEFEEKCHIFPSAWNMPRLFASEFCHVTRGMLEKLTKKRINEIDVKLLIFAVQRTNNFESLLCKRFPVLASEPSPVGSVQPQQKEHAFEVSAEKPKNVFQGAISRVFDSHMNIYITAQDRNLNALVDQFCEKFRDGSTQPKRNFETNAVTISSSGDLFVVYKKCIQQLSQLTTDSKFLVDLAQVFKKYLREYAHRCMIAFMPKINASQATGTAGLIQSLLKEGEVARLTQDEIYLICCLLTTAEFCAETTQQLQDKLKEKVQDLTSHSRLEMNSEQEVFHNVISNCIHVLVQDLESMCEPSLQAMTKMQWSAVESVGDESRYVANIKSHVKISVPKIRDYLGNARKYFIQFCLKFSTSFINRFLTCLFRCKPINVTGAEQLLLDTHSLKTELANLPNVDSSISRKPPAAYTNVVMKGMNKAEMILKLVMTELNKYDQFIEQYLKLLPDSDLVELQKVLEMKSVRRMDQTPILDLYRSKMDRGQTADRSSLTFDPSLLTTSGNSGTSGSIVSSMDAESTIRKLEKLVRKRVL